MRRERVLWSREEVIEYLLYYLDDGLALLEHLFGDLLDTTLCHYIRHLRMEVYRHVGTA